MGDIFSGFFNSIINLKWLRLNIYRTKRQLYREPKQIWIFLWYIIVIILLSWATITLIRFILTDVNVSDIIHVVYLGFITAIRVMILIMISSLIWVPIGVWIGLNPRASQIVQPIAQFLAAFPVNLLFPIVAGLILQYQLNVNIWTSPLMILGTQWYILFNVIAGTIALPKNLLQATETLNVSGWLWWRRLILPGIFPYYITGAITAAGGAWNISILAEAVSWGTTPFICYWLRSIHNTGLFARKFPAFGVRNYHNVIICFDD